MGNLTSQIVYKGPCSDRIVKSPPDLAVIGPLGSCLAIRIVGFIFITHVRAGRGVGRTESARLTKSAKLLARPTSTLNLPPTQSSQNTLSSSVPCTMFPTCSHVEWWLHGQLIVYIFDVYSHYLARNRSTWPYCDLKCGHGKLPSLGMFFAIMVDITSLRTF